MKNLIILIIAALFVLANAYVMSTTSDVFAFVMSAIGALCGAVVCCLADNNKF